MSVADEILKLKELLDSNAITQEEFEKMKKSLLEKGTSNQKPDPQPSQSPRPQTTYNRVTTNGTNFSYRPSSKRYFNAAPFRTAGWIAFAFGALFCVILFFMLIHQNYEASMYMVWETTTLPISIALAMGIILKMKDDSAQLMILSIVFLAISIILSIVSTSLFYQALQQEINRYQYYYLYLFIE